jgi:hypothetical protein
VKVVVKGPQLVKAYPSVVVMLGIVPSKFKPTFERFRTEGWERKRGNNLIVFWFRLVQKCGYAEIPETLTPGRGLGPLG